MSVKLEVTEMRFSVILYKNNIQKSESVFRSLLLYRYRYLQIWKVGCSQRAQQGDSVT